MKKELDPRSRINILILEANQMNCQLVASALRPRRYRVAVVASAVESARALALLKEMQPDVAIISARLQSGPVEGFSLLRELRSARSTTRAIMLLDTRERELVIDAFRYGAHGVIFRDEPLETLCKCIHAVHNGQVWANSQQLGYLLDALSTSMPIHLQDARGANILSKREEDVVRLVADGMTNREISHQLSLSEHTVRNYLFRVFEKLGISNRVELVLYCVQQRQTSDGALHAEAGQSSSQVGIPPRATTSSASRLRFLGSPRERMGQTSRSGPASDRSEIR
jgi:two-component system nitrate/nitrite response regulator NarL